MSHAALFLRALTRHEFTELVRLHRPWLTPAQAAAYLGVSVRALECWRASGTGPQYRRVGRTIRYHLDALDAIVNTDAQAGEDSG